MMLFDRGREAWPAELGLGFWLAGASSNLGIAKSNSFIKDLYLASEIMACSTGKWPSMLNLVKSVALGTMQAAISKSMLMRSTMWKLRDESLVSNDLRVSSIVEPMRT